MCRSYDPLLVRKIPWVLYLGVFYLAVALVFIQGARLHVHFYDHDPVTSDHVHQEQAHFNYGASETGHPGEVAKIDLSQQGFLKTLSFGSLAIALFVAVIVVRLPRLLIRVPWRHDRRGPLVSWLFNLRPPLRAPPL
jgi:hypothetical protein